jgi:multidrug efflux pump subunit AcrA (membrane-fusion protein)
LQTGQAATIRLTGVPTTFEGHVRLLAAVIDPQTRLGEVRIALKPDPNLRPGAFATGEVVLGSGVKPIIPQTALLSDRNGTYVLLAGDDHRVARRAVTVGPAQSAGVVIADGLDGSERVISIAGAFLRPGELVRVDASPAAP